MTISSHMPSTFDTDFAPSGFDADLDAALAWLVRLHAGDAQETDWASYEAWISESNAHVSAAQRADRLWAQLGQARMRKPRVAKAALVAVGLALSLALAGLGTGVLGEPGVLLADVRTGTGESRTVVLEDGSTVQLDTGTAIDVDYTASRRVVRLLAGQIHVTVKPDAGRPFDVDGAGGTTQALGTAFNVRSDPGQVSVTVTEHAVRVRYPAASAGVTVSAGQQVRYGEGIALVPTTANLHALTAWRRGLLTFDDKPLGEVIAELGRYRPGWIVIRDDALRRLPVTGVFSTTDTDEMLDALQATLPVHVRRLPWVTIIESASRD